MDANGVSIFEKQKLKFSRLAHERNERFGGEFFRAKIIYKELLSAEGHRHYPLREPKCLRMTPDLMLPLGEEADVLFWFILWSLVLILSVSFTLPSSLFFFPSSPLLFTSLHPLLTSTNLHYHPSPSSPLTIPPHSPHTPGPWFENWGRMVAVHPALSNEDRIQITKQLLKACDPNSKQGFIPNQVLYGIRYNVIVHSSPPAFIK